MVSTSGNSGIGESSKQAPAFLVEEVSLAYPQLYGRMAKTRAGPPDPPSSLIGATIRNAPLSGSALGVAAELGRVQLNVRFAPVDDAERALQAAYSSVVDSLHGKSDARATANSIDELNKLLAAA